MKTQQQNPSDQDHLTRSGSSNPSSPQQCSVDSILSFSRNWFRFTLSAGFRPDTFDKVNQTLFP